MERERAEEEALRRADVEEESGERRHRRERRQTDSGEESQAASEAMESLVAVTGLDLEVEVTVDGDDVEVEIGGPDAELLLEEEGKPLSAIEHLLPKVLRGISGRKYFCHVDCLGFRERRRSELETLARELADEVRETGDSRTLEPLSPAERRIVHMSLADDPDVETESTGGGYLKRLTIWPV
ncbi:MAG: hypothetical protein KDD47_09185 [Acidobacteria bacterium]|nr:hypothetical protein [Acidobacteriota bacterium]